jgi:hypothetical protein
VILSIEHFIALIYFLTSFLTPKEFPVKYLLLIKPGEVIAINSLIPTNEFDALTLR